MSVLLVIRKDGGPVTPILYGFPGDGFHSLVKNGSLAEGRILVLDMGMTGNDLNTGVTTLRSRLGELLGLLWN